ncbi:MAG: hypothetical protein ACPGQS_09205 [Bradymonadia bacterium]
MAKKKSKGRVKSKAAQATAAAQADKHQPSFQAPTGRGGLMTKMRSGFQNAAGVSEQPEPPSIVQKATWFLVIAAAVFFFARGL